MDSIFALIKHQKDDTNKVNSINRLSDRLIRIANYTRADSLTQIALVIANKNGFRKGLAEAMNNLGDIYFYKDNYLRSMNYYLRTKEISDSIGYTLGIASALNGIGEIYESQKEYDTALSEELKSLELAERIKENECISSAADDIGRIYEQLENYPKALEYSFVSLKASEIIKDTFDLLPPLTDIGDIYLQEGDYKNALEYSMKALVYEKSINNEDYMSTSLLNIGQIYQKEKNYEEALKYANQSLEIGKKITSVEDIKEAEKTIGELYEAKGNYKEAIEHNRIYERLQDSIYGPENTEQVVREALNSEFSMKQALEKVGQEKKDELNKAKQERQKLVSVIAITAAILLLIIAIIIFRYFRTTSKQKVLIEKQNVLLGEQKKLVEEKNKDITDSIHYASRIQRALLTTEEYIGKHLGEYFILFKPRDIVSGDFYWANEVETNEGPLFLICVGDCTGHGVPGAFMSLLNISMLNEVNIEKKINEPSKILDEVRAHIIKALNPEGKDEGKDGMDCVLCSFNLESKKLNVACANNPLWIVRDGGIIEYKPDKMPVGLHGGTLFPFNLQTVQLKENDVVYIFTDGYADQFGGPKGKKFKYKQLEEKLKSIASLPMNSQKEELNKTIENWKGGLEQVDDILIIGIRV